VERLVLKLVSDHGAPDLLLIQEAEEWDPPAWENLARDQQIEIGYFPADDTKECPEEATSAMSQINKLAQQLAERFRSMIDFDNKETRRLVAKHLAEGTQYLRSLPRRSLVLAKAIELDENCIPALLAAGDHEFQRGDLEKALKLFSKASDLERPRFRPGDVQWWSNTETRPHLRALFGRALTNWHLNNLSDATADAEELLQLNPRDNQGVRFLVPLLYQLNDQHDAALRFYRDYDADYPGDYSEPGFLFGWACALGREEEETLAVAKYRSAMLRNIYIAPMLLDLTEPRPDIWHPNDRSEPDYAAEFSDSFGTLWDRDAAAHRFLEECYTRLKPDIEKLIELRLRMADFQDQRYEPKHEELWKKLVDEERAILGEPDISHREG
jgi:hypothetical protein